MAAMGSPTKRTMSRASSGRFIDALNIGMAGPRSSRPRSAAVTTASTPGIVKASLASTSVMRAWAMVERT